MVMGSVRLRRARRGGPAAAGPPLPKGMRGAIALSLLPGALLFVTFFLVPLGMLVVTSLADWGGVGFTYLGLDNYGAVLADDTFWQAVKNTLFYCAAGVFIQVPLGVAVGIMLAQRRPGWRVFRTIVFIPYVISGAAYALIFGLLYNPRYGLLNDLLGVAGIEGRDWLFSTSTALPAIAGTFVFIIGFNVVLVMTEVAAIPRELYEAAWLDGASEWQRHLRVTLPLLRNVIGTLVLITLLGCLALFDLVFIMTSGGPADATVTLTVYAFRAYTNGAWGYANAVGVVIVVVGLLLIVGVRRLFRIGERTL